jgi:signal transduction histidine kinase
VEVRGRGDSTVEISIADHGPGIPDDEKPKVLTRFYRGDASRGTPGVGLGLTLVASVAKVHGGLLELHDNHPGLRAQMVIALGVGVASKEPAREAKAPVAPAGHLAAGALPPTPSPGAPA